MAGDGSGRPGHGAAAKTLRVIASILFMSTLVVVAGIGLAALLGQRGDNEAWNRWSDVGETFGVVNSVISAMAVAALVVTWSLQARDMAAQKQILEDVQTALNRSAEVDVRKSHVTLIRMAIDNLELAAVWPNPGQRTSTTRPQHLYANLLIQHARLQHTVGIASREELISNLRFLFASPAIRAFWHDTADSRGSIYVDGTEENDFAVLVDQIWREYEAVVACNGKPGTGTAEPQQQRSGWPANRDMEPTADL